MLRNRITWQFQVGLTSANTQGNSPTSLPDMVLWQEHRAVIRSWEACHVLYIICIRTLNIHARRMFLKVLTEDTWKT